MFTDVLAFIGFAFLVCLVFYLFFIGCNFVNSTNTTAEHLIQETKHRRDNDAALREKINNLSEALFEVVEKHNMLEAVVNSWVKELKEAESIEALTTGEVTISAAQRARIREMLKTRKGGNTK